MIILEGIWESQYILIQVQIHLPNPHSTFLSKNHIAFVLIYLNKMLWWRWCLPTTILLRSWKGCICSYKWFEQPIFSMAFWTSHVSQSLYILLITIFFLFFITYKYCETLKHFFIKIDCHKTEIFYDTFIENTHVQKSPAIRFSICKLISVVKAIKSICTRIAHVWKLTYFLSSTFIRLPMTPKICPHTSTCST